DGRGRDVAGLRPTQVRSGSRENDPRHPRRPAALGPLPGRTPAGRGTGRRGPARRRDDHRAPGAADRGPTAPPDHPRDDGPDRQDPGRSDPDKAARLKLALDQSREDGNLDRIETILLLLGDEQWQQALREQKELHKALERILDILLDRESERRQLKDPVEEQKQLVDLQIKELETISQKLGDLIQRERNHFHESEKFADPEGTLRRAATARAKLADLIERQQKLIGSTRKAAADGEPGDKLAAAQERVRRDLERLGTDLERLAKQAPGLDTGRSGLEGAAADMRRAEKKLRQDEVRGAVPDEEEAKRKLERLRETLERMEQELKKITRLPEYEDLAEDQDETTEKTEDLIKKMKEGGTGGPAPDGGPGGATPGQRQVEGAKQAMQRASRNLRSRSARAANSDQKEALDRLNKAREELEEILRQLREEEQLMLLDALERRLTMMLQKQRVITKGTVGLSLRIKGATRISRADKDKGVELGEGETELAAEADKVLEILREEGTTVVIPDVIEDLRRDLDGLARRLARLDVGEYTKRVQRDVEETLRDLIEVIREERERRQGEEGGDGSEGDGEEGLLPSSAELKMLRALQMRVNRRTSLFDKMFTAGRTPREELDRERGRLVEKQDSVSGLTRTMADRLNREEE
ncbi:MAG: hypothetical protein ACE5JG_08630, partial [Planctomycetota bacterium]